MKRKKERARLEQYRPGCVGIWDGYVYRWLYERIVEDAEVKVVSRFEV